MLYRYILLVDIYWDELMHTSMRKKFFHIVKKKKKKIFAIIILIEL